MTQCITYHVDRINGNIPLMYKEVSFFFDLDRTD